MADLYSSSVLRCNPRDDDCLVCNFLNGKRNESVYLEVIRILDGKLADEEDYNRKLVQVIGKNNEKRDDC